MASKGKTADSVYLGPTEFLRWLATQGVKLARKNLYETYFGARASHPVETSSDGKKIHKLKALEMIRLVQSGSLAGDDDTDRIIRERQQAEALYKSGKGQLAMIELETRRGERLRREDVSRVCGAAVSSFKNSLRTMEHNLAPKLVGKTETEIRAALEAGHHEALRLLALDFSSRAEVPGTGKPRRAKIQPLEK